MNNNIFDFMRKGNNNIPEKNKIELSKYYH